MPTTIFTASPGGSFGGFAQYSYRNALAVTGGSLTQVRVTFVASSSGWITTHASIGVATAPTGDPTHASTVAAPVELLFSAGHGFTLGASASIASDWLTFGPFLSSDKLVVIVDQTDATGAPAYVNGGTNATQAWYLSGTASYTATSDAGFANSYGGDIGIGLIEVQSVAGSRAIFRQSNLSGLGVGGSFYQDPMA